MTIDKLTHYSDVLKHSETEMPELERRLSIERANNQAFENELQIARSKDQSVPENVNELRVANQRYTSSLSLIKELQNSIRILDLATKNAEDEKASMAQTTGGHEWAKRNQRLSDAKEIVESKRGPINRALRAIGFR